MKWRRILGLVAVSLAMSGSMLGSDPEKRLQVRWSELKQVIGGKKVTLQLAEGARVEGRIKKVTPISLDFKITKSSEWAAYPRGKSRFREKPSLESRSAGSRKIRGGELGRPWEHLLERCLEAWLLFTAWKSARIARSLLIASPRV